MLAGTGSDQPDPWAALPDAPARPPPHHCPLHLPLLRCADTGPLCGASWLSGARSGLLSSRQRLPYRCRRGVGGLFSARGRVPAAGKHRQPPGLFPATMWGDVCDTVWWSPRRSCRQECGTSSCGGQRSEGQRSQATLPWTPVTGGRGRWWPLGRSPDLFFPGHSLQ